MSLSPRRWAVIAGGTLAGVLLVMERPTPAPRPENPHAAALVGTLFHLREDYPEALESGHPERFAEPEALAAEARAQAQALDGPLAKTVRSQVTALEAAVHQHASSIELTERVGTLLSATLAAGNVRAVPSRRPDLARGARVYAQSCASCHGVTGAGDSKVAATLDPRPSSFLDSGVMNPLSAFQAFSAVTHGLSGTAMPAFETLAEEERWDVSFFILSLRQPGCARATPVATLEELSTLPDNELVARHGEAGLACLRVRPFHEEVASLGR